TRRGLSDPPGPICRRAMEEADGAGHRRRARAGEGQGRNMKLVTTPNIKDADGIYEALIALHAGRSEEESMAVNARLILLLINHIGDPEAVRDAIDRAAGTTEEEGL